MRYEDVTIIGAGQCGLAMSRALSSRGIDHLVMDRGLPGNAWRTERWHSLRLLTPNWANGLPGAPYRGKDADGFAPISAFAAQLEAYAQANRTPLLASTKVRRVSAAAGKFLIESDDGPIISDALVLATGACALPSVPKIAGLIPSNVVQTTPSKYKRPSDLPDGGVLVVGASASGVQLARELQLSGRQVTLAVGGHVRMPRTYRGDDIEHWLYVTGILDERFDEIDDLERARRAPSPQLFGSDAPVDLNALQSLGIDIVGRFTDIRDGRALFSGGLANACVSADLKMHRLLDRVDAWIADHGLDIDLPEPDRPETTTLSPDPRLEMSLITGEIRSILWATGYKPDFSWLDLPVFDARGRLRHRGGIVDAPGLYALGLPFLRRRKSHQISGAGDDAEDLADHLARHLHERRAA